MNSSSAVGSNRIIHSELFTLSEEKAQGCKSSKSQLR
jgi:hypothetical protein